VVGDSGLGVGKSGELVERICFFFVTDSLLYISLTFDDRTEAIGGSHLKLFKSLGESSWTLKPVVA